MRHPNPIAIESYDPSWPRRFEAERGALQRIFGSDVRIDHIGSTAVPGLGAKPIIDILLGAVKLNEIESHIPELIAAGWEYMPQHEAILPERRFFAKPKQRPRDFHLHAVEAVSPFWQEHVLFRDFLRRHRDVASEYEALKFELARQYGFDRDGYTEAKTSFIRGVLVRARKELT
jgi:GrpB-like predicted nucleotidyltransferase (UPF0157 family)